jgi:hypothetical protein
MTLLQYFQANVNTKPLVPGQNPSLAGQCFQWVDQVIHNVFGLPYFYASYAIDFWTQPGWLLTYFDKITDGSIKAGDIVVYSGGINGGYGHVDVAAQDGSVSSYVGYDSNWNTLDLEQVTHNGHDNAFILGSLRLKSATPPPAPNPSSGTARVLRTCNVRSQPNTTPSAIITSVLQPGDTFQYTGVVTGESVSGNANWVHSTLGHYVWSGNCAL